MLQKRAGVAKLFYLLMKKAQAKIEKQGRETRKRNKSIRY